MAKPMPQVTMHAHPAAETCALCQRMVGSLTWHHLVPKQEGGRHAQTVPLCQPCHSTIHNTFTNKELKKEYNTIQALRAAEQMQAYLRWISQSRIEFIKNKDKRRKR